MKFMMPMPAASRAMERRGPRRSRTFARECRTVRSIRSFGNSRNLPLARRDLANDAQGAANLFQRGVVLSRSRAATECSGCATRRLGGVHAVVDGDDDEIVHVTTHRAPLGFQHAATL